MTCIFKNCVVNCLCTYISIITTSNFCFQHYLLLHYFWVHIRNKADGEFANDFAWDDSLGPCLGESPLDSMQWKGGVPPAVHEDLLLQEKMWTINMRRPSPSEESHRKAEAILWCCAAAFSLPHLGSIHPNQNQFSHTGFALPLWQMPHCHTSQESWSFPSCPPGSLFRKRQFKLNWKLHLERMVKRMSFSRLTYP